MLHESLKGPLGGLLRLQELAVQLLVEGSSPTSLIAKATRNFPPAAAAVFLIDGNGRPHFDGLFYPG